jgi:hypothetical protein
MEWFPPPVHWVLGAIDQEPLPSAWRRCKGRSKVVTSYSFGSFKAALKLFLIGLYPFQAARPLDPFWLSA